MIKNVERKTFFNVKKALKLGLVASALVSGTEGFTVPGGRNIKTVGMNTNISNKAKILNKELEKVIRISSRELKEAEKNQKSGFDSEFSSKHIQKVEELLDKGAKPNQPDEYSLTPVHIASEVDNYKALEILLENGGNPNVKAEQYSESTALHLAAIRSSVKTLKLLVKHNAKLHIGNKRGELPLHVSTMYNTYKVVDYLAKATKNVNILSKAGLTALHYATSSLNNNAILALRDNNADFNIPDKKHGCTPLFSVFGSWKKDEYGQIDLSTAKLLLDSGADPNFRDKQGRTPLHYAAKFHDGGRMARLLLEYGADLSIECNMRGHETPYDIAKIDKNEDVIKVFKEYTLNKNLSKVIFAKTDKNNNLYSRNKFSKDI